MWGPSYPPGDYIQRAGNIANDGELLMKEEWSAARACAFDSGRIDPFYYRGDWNVVTEPRRPIDATFDCHTKVDRVGLHWVFDPPITTLGDWRSNNVVH
jgi:hypothetical protein